jgi:S-adenosylmethionine:tRNA ribosyltransferase-isomerase
MRAEAFHYELPPELIAQHPTKERELARLMVLPRVEGPPEHRRVSDLPETVPPGALVVINDTRVVPARLLGRRSKTGGKVEMLLVQHAGQAAVRLETGEVREAQVWKALGKSLRPGGDIEIQRPDGEGTRAALMVRALRRTDDEGLVEVALWTTSSESIGDALRASGRVPLPPYIRRDPEPQDAHRYQTVYARNDGAVAAPTAGLHLTGTLIERLTARGCEVERLTLHVGLGTFRPVTASDLDLHRMQAERFVVPPSAADAVARARARGRPVIAVGTTTVRALETAFDPDRPGHVLAMSGETRLLVQPGHSWRVVDGLLTNFHLPRSTLLALVCALGGRERVLDAYRAAVSEGYRFFSYGDAMFVWRRE